MKSMKKFASSETMKDLYNVKGGYIDPVYIGGWEETRGGADEELSTKNGTGDCEPFWAGSHNCVDETYICGE